MVLQYSVYVVVCLYVLKIIWNLGVPFALAWRLYNDAEREETPGISLCPFVEGILIVVAIPLTFAADESHWTGQCGTVMTAAVAAGVVSYVLIGIIGFLSGAVISIVERRK